jgi:hypothetical protein
MKVYATKMNDTYEVEKGVRYKIDVSGEWHDGNISCDHKGWNGSRFRWISWLYDNPIVSSFKICPNQNYMRLMGKVGDRYYDLAQSEYVTFSRSGLLKMFANDNRYLYWNNRGHLEVELTEVG